MEYITDALAAIKANKLRAFLTAFGLSWGLLTLMILLAAGKGLENGFLEKFGDNFIGNIWIQSFSTSVPYDGYSKERPIILQIDDLRVTQSSSSEILKSAGEYFTNEKYFVSYAPNFGSFDLIGVTSDYFPVRTSVKLIDGRLLNQNDHDLARKVVILTQPATFRLFGVNSSIGKYVQINGIYFMVAGIYEDRLANENNNRLYIPYSTYQEAFNGDGSLTKIGLLPSSKGDSKHLEEQVKELLRKKHSVSPTDDRAITAESLNTQVNHTNLVFYCIRFLIWTIGIGTLITGAVGLANIMMVSVKERIFEIGLKKAIGAKSSEIIKSILIETLIVTGMGGISGLSIGFIVIGNLDQIIKSFGSKNVFFIHPGIDSLVVIAAIVILILSGVLASVFPAIQAAKINPIEAMRGNF